MTSRFTFTARWTMDLKAALENARELVGLPCRDLDVAMYERQTGSWWACRVVISMLPCTSGRLVDRQNLLARRHALVFAQPGEAIASRGSRIGARVIHLLRGLYNRDDIVEVTIGAASVRRSVRQQDRDIDTERTRTQASRRTPYQRYRS
jgi:hypothetical protein